MDLETLTLALRALQSECTDLRTAMQLVSDRATAADVRAAGAEALYTALTSSSSSSGGERLRSTAPQLFDGLDKDSDALLDFEYDLKAYYDTCHISSLAAQLKHAITLLSGPAKACYRSHLRNTETQDGTATADQCSSISDLIHRILKPEFLSPNYVLSARTQLARCVQTGSVTDYIATFRQICLRIP